MKGADIKLTVEGGDPAYYRVTLDGILGNPHVKAVVLDAPVQRMTWKVIGVGASRERTLVPMNDRRDGAHVRVEEVGGYTTSAIRSQDGVIDREKRSYDVGDTYYIALLHVDREWTDEDEARLVARYALRARVEAAQDRMIALGVKATVAAQQPSGRVGMPLDEFERILTVLEAQAVEVEAARHRESW